MKAFKDYDKTQAYTNGGEKLPVGGYVLKILNVKYQEGQNGYSDKITVSYDIAEGDQKDFYKRNYDGQQGEDKKWKGHADVWVPKDDGSDKDEWTKRRFKTFTVAVEDSNDGYHWDWDESKLKGKLVGGIFNDKEYEVNGKTGFYTALNRFVSVETIRQSDFKIPEPTYLKKKNAPAPTMPNDFVAVPDGDQEELPFT